MEIFKQTFTVLIILFICSGVGIIFAQGAPTSISTTTPNLIGTLSSTAFPTATHSSAISTAIAKGECLQPFSTFAYQAPITTISPQMTPPSPWVIEATHPLYEHNGYLILNTVAARSINGHQEIWVAGGISDPEDLDIRGIITIYHPQSRGWEFIPSNVENTDIVVAGLHVAEDGTIWGQTVYENSSALNIPVLRKFNENTRRFELDDGVLELSLVAGSEPPHIVLDQQGIFWIFVGFDGIYSYNPATKTTEKWIDLPELDVDYTALSPDGSIYFAHQSSLGNFRLVGDELYQFFPETGKVESVGLPASNEEWPIFAGLLVDHIGRLWLGSTGYRDLGGAWHLMHPYPERYFEIVDTGRISYIWAFPRPILESSDGILWFQKYLDTSGQWEGTAWYDPNLGEGCLITNMPTNIVEDSHQQLWMMVDGILYRYSLNAQ